MSTAYRTIGGGSGENLDPFEVVATDAASNLLNIVSGTVGHVLTSTGPASLPTFQANAGGSVPGGAAGQVV